MHLEMNKRPEIVFQRTCTFSNIHALSNGVYFHVTVLVVVLLVRRTNGQASSIGSKRKAELTRQRLEAKGFTKDVVAAVRTPVGLAIGAETPEEIAISILSEIIGVRRGRAPGPDTELETKEK